MLWNQTEVEAIRAASGNNLCTRLNRRKSDFIVEPSGKKLNLVSPHFFTHNGAPPPTTRAIMRRLKVDSIYDSVRNEPRFRALYKKMNFPP
jgi:hypothetical protein